MDAQPSNPEKSVYCFGPFRLKIGERLLLKEDVPVELGGRAFDLLATLVTRPNESLSKQELLTRVWPDVAVEETSLRVHMAALRKALGDGEGEARYILTIAGRGYCFVAPVSVATDGEAATHPPGGSIDEPSLPPLLRRMVGRDSSIRTVTTLLADSRFVTIVGPGGVGKTMLAVAVAHEVLATFEGAVFFVDLGALTDPGLIASSVASLLGLAVQSDDPTPSLLAYLRNKRMLLLLDNCEHLIEEASALAVRIFSAAPQVHILATSREHLRVEGEQIYKLMPLMVPPDEVGLTAQNALSFPAVQLFVDRAAANGYPLNLTDQDADTVASICRKLDGLPLPIELAAARVGIYGPQQTLALLDQRLTMLWLGQRTAPPRQQTLRAMLDWSYELLSDTEKTVLRRLSVFVGPFTVGAVQEVVPSGNIDPTAALTAVESLVAKSLVVVQPVGTTMRYRLPETTRGYALAISAPEAEQQELSARHATFVCRSLQQMSADWLTHQNSPNRASLLADIGNLRAALDWCFSPAGRPGIGVPLAAAAAPVFMALSLLTECLRWTERALLAQVAEDDTEMRLQAALGMSWMFTRGNGEQARVALKRSLKLSTRRGDVSGELRSLSLLHMYYRRTGDYRATLECAERSLSLAQSTGSVTTLALAHSLLGVSLYHVGELNRARAELEAALEAQRGMDWTSTFLLGFDHYNLSRSILARSLWLLGFPSKAVEVAREAVSEAGRLNHPVSYSIASTWAISVYLWTGDVESAEELLRQSLAHAEAHSLTPNVLQGRGFRGELLLRRGDYENGIRELQECLKELRATRYSLLSTPFSIALGDGLIDMGRGAEAVKIADEAIDYIKSGGELIYMSELLRVKGRALATMPAQSPQTASVYFSQSMDWSRRQGARSCELRAATSQAVLLSDHGDEVAARDLLAAVYAMFSEGHETGDLRAAASLLSHLNKVTGSTTASDHVGGVTRLVDIETGLSPTAH